MARPANEKNAPSDDDVQSAVANIEQGHGELLRERGIYMQKCRKIREAIANDYEQAADHGISKKLLKKVIKERELERRIAGLTDDLEPDEINEHQMLLEKLGEFANTPLGSAALQRAEARSKTAAAANA
jgi:proline dehydrogenase